MEPIYTTPTQVGNSFAFDLCRHVNSTPVRPATFAYVFSPEEGSCRCSTVRIGSIETRVFDRYTHPADEEVAAPRIGSTGSRLEELGWNFAGQITTRDYLIRSSDHEPEPLFETLSSWDEYLAEIVTVSSVEHGENANLDTLKIRFAKKARDHFGLNDKQ